VGYEKVGIGHHSGFFNFISEQMQGWDGLLAAIEARSLYLEKNLTNLTTSPRVAAGGARRDGATFSAARSSGVISA